MEHILDIFRCLKKNSNLSPYFELRIPRIFLGILSTNSEDVE